MSTKHRIALAMSKGAHLTNFEHSVYEDGTTAYFVFRDPETARVIGDMLQTIFKSAHPQLIHNGRKPK